MVFTVYDVCADLKLKGYIRLVSQQHRCVAGSLTGIQNDNKHPSPPKSKPRRTRARLSSASTGLVRPPTLEGVLSKTHTFRWIASLAGNTAYNLTATDMNLLLGAVVDSTHIIPLIGSWRIRKIKYYTMLDTGGNATLPGMRAGPIVRWSDSSASLTEETKASVKQPIDVGVSSANTGTLVPPRSSILSFWHRDNASGNILDVVNPGSLTISMVLDLTLQFTLVNQEATSSTGVTAANTAVGINMREVLSATAIPVGMQAYAP